jgi:hypothetical protein
MRSLTCSSAPWLRPPRPRLVELVPRQTTDLDQPLEERYFERRQIKEAIAFAEAGGIAVHRNFDHYHGSTIRGMMRERPFLHVIGMRPRLEAWGGQHGLRPEWIQPEKRRKVAHYDVFGKFAEQLIARLEASP